MQQNPHIYDRANGDILNALLIYDQMKVKDERLLDAILGLSEWIIKGTANNNVIAQLNRYQIIKRRRQLTKKEQEEIYSLMPADNQQDIQTAIYILLDYQLEAKRTFMEMNAEDQELFKSMPIYHFMATWDED